MMDHSKRAIAAFDQFALSYQEKYMDVSLYQNSLEYFCNKIFTDKASILELACGPGNVTKYLIETRPDFQVLATDMSLNMLNLAAKNVHEAKFQQLDCRKIDSLKNKYHGVMVSFCLPYLTIEETSQLIANSSELLLMGGLLYLSTMEDEYQNSGYKKGSSKEAEPIMMHYYLEKDLVSLLEKNQFELTFIDRKQYIDQSNSLVTDLIMIAKKVQK